MIFIDYKDRRPVYEQIADHYEALVLSGVLSPNTPLPSVRSLAMELSINPNTIQHAYAEMERRGLLYSVKGRGSFIDTSQGLIESKKEELVKEIKQKFLEAYNIKIDEQLLATMLKEVYQNRKEDL